MEEVAVEPKSEAAFIGPVIDESKQLELFGDEGCIIVCPIIVTVA
jgi:hypothetical protein